MRGDPVPLHEQIRAQRRATLAGVLLGLLGLCAVGGVRRDRAAAGLAARRRWWSGPAPARCTRWRTSPDRLVPVTQPGRRPARARRAGPGGDRHRPARCRCRCPTTRSAAAPRTPAAAVPGALAAEPGPDRCRRAGRCATRSARTGGLVATTVIGGAAPITPLPPADGVLLAGSGRRQLAGGRGPPAPGRPRRRPAAGRVRAGPGARPGGERGAAGGAAGGPGAAHPGGARPRCDRPRAGCRVGSGTCWWPGRWAGPRSTSWCWPAGCSRCRAGRRAAAGGIGGPGDPAGSAGRGGAPRRPSTSCRSPAGRPRAPRMLDGRAGRGCSAGAGRPTVRPGERCGSGGRAAGCRPGRSRSRWPRADGAGPRLDAVAVGAGGAVRAVGADPGAGAGLVWLISATGVGIRCSTADRGGARGDGGRSRPRRRCCRCCRTGPEMDLRAGRADLLPTIRLSATAE